MLHSKNRAQMKDEDRLHRVGSRTGGMGYALSRSLRVTLIYLVVGCLWIVFSDLIAQSIFGDLSSLLIVSISKGVFYVVATAALIFGLVYRPLRNAVSARESAQAANTLLKAANEELTREKEKLTESQTRLKESEVLLRAVFEQAPVGIYIGRDSNYADKIFGESPAINAMYATITGRTVQELTQGSWMDITHPDDLKADLDGYEKMRAGITDGYDMEKRYIRPDGSAVWVHMIISRLYLDRLADPGYLCIIEDISQRKQQEIKLKYLSERDPLTGMYNRVCFEELLGQDAVERAGEKRALLLVTLSRLAAVNIAHGYAYGESLVKAAAGRLAGFGAPDCLLFHLANDRFIFYVRRYQEKAELDAFCCRIVEALDASLNEAGVQCSVGVLELDGAYDSVDSMLKLVSIAAEYAGENQGRHCFFDKKMEAAINRRNIIKSELAKCAREEEDGHLYMVYQPIFHARTNMVYGFEALARFTGYIVGPVSPNEFIPIAEEAQLIVPLGKKIIRLACGFLKRLEEQGIRDKTVSINISATQLRRDDFLPDLLQAIAQTGVNAGNITLEITESIFTDNYQLINDKLRTIREKGIAVSIDDFGTGYSSLARENELNVSCLKLDKQFIDGLLVLDPREVIAGDIISMAHKLGHSVVAEGVEHEKQREYLLEYQCDYIQGYLFSRPLPEDAAIALLK